MSTLKDVGSKPWILLLEAWTMFDIKVDKKSLKKYQIKILKFLYIITVFAGQCAHCTNEQAFLNGNC